MEAGTIDGRGGLDDKAPRGEGMPSGLGLGLTRGVEPKVTISQSISFYFIKTASGGSYCSQSGQSAD